MRNPFLKNQPVDDKDEIKADSAAETADEAAATDAEAKADAKKSDKKRRGFGKKSDKSSKADDSKEKDGAGTGNASGESANSDDDVYDEEKKGFFSKFGKKKKKRRLNFEDYPHLLTLRPQESYCFFSDYFKFDDDHYSCILTLMHSDAAIDRFGSFWGLNLLPRNLPPTSKVVRFEQVHRMSDQWVQSHQTRAESVADANANAQEQGGTNTTKRKAGKAQEDLQAIAEELANGATYLHVHYRLQVISPSLEELDICVDRIRKGYIDAFSSLTVEPYHGEQKKELSTLLRKNETKLGTGFYYTSTEYAGSYNLVTHGIEDPDGEFVGFMKGDVNTSAILFDIDNFRRNIVIADEYMTDEYGKLVRRSNVWGSKVAESCLLNSHRVAHFLISEVDMSELSPAFPSFTNIVKMSQGDLNMFEVFGDRAQQLTLFPKQLEKIRVMTELISEPTESDRAIIRGSLEQVLTQFYIDSRMWYPDAPNHTDRLRIVGIPHNEVPKLEFFISQLEQKHKALMNGTDDELTHAYNILKMIFRSMLSNNGDLFNTSTSRIFDTANKAGRVIYDFSDLLLRGQGIAMAQMINVVSYALSGLGRGDVAIFHGCDNIKDKSVQDYLRREFEFLYKRGGRVCLLYDNVSNYMDTLDFNDGIRSDYTITSTMVPADADTYEHKFGVNLPGPLRSLLTQTNGSHNYLHRGLDNVIFQPVLDIGVERKRRGVS